MTSDERNRVGAEDAAAQAALARQRFFTMAILRLSGAFIVMFGMAVSLGRFSWLHGKPATWIGFVIAVIGLLQFGIVPRLLARLWSSARSDK